MRLARSGAPGYEKPSIVLEDGTRHDVSVLLSEIDEATLRGPWRTSLGALAPDKLPMVDPHTRLAAPVERVRRVFRIWARSQGFGVDVRFGDPAGAEDDYPLTALGQQPDYVVRAGIAVVMGEDAAVAGLSLYTDIVPGPSGDPGADTLLRSRHGLYALGPYLLDLREMAGDERLEIRLSVRLGSRSAAIDITRHPGDIEALAEAVNRLCRLEPGDILLLDMSGAPRHDWPLFCLKRGDRVEAVAGKFGRQSRKVVQRAAGHAFKSVAEIAAGDGS